MNLKEEGQVWVKYSDQELIATNNNRSYVTCYVGFHYISVIEREPLNKEISFKDAFHIQGDSKGYRYFGYTFTTEPDQWIQLMKEDGDPIDLFQKDPDL